MNTIFRAIPWLILFVPLPGLAYFYDALPNEILIARSFFGSTDVIAPKSLLTVFRVPLIEMVCASAIWMMRRKQVGENGNFSLMWTILLYTVALKSLFQFFEIVSPGNAANVFFYLTLGVVGTGIMAAFFAGRNFFSKPARGRRTFSPLEKTILLFLLIGYLGLAIVPILVFK